MDMFTRVMVFGALGGLIALGLIANELGWRHRISPSGRLFLAAALGLGVLTVSAKTLSFVYIERALPMLHVDISRDRPAGGPLPDFHKESGITAPWVALIEFRENADPAKVALGRRLFFDKALSRDGTIACASCHRADRGGSDGRRVSLGVGGLSGTRNAPSVLNAALLSRQFWDGRADTLEAQAHGPVLNPREMAMPDAASVERALAGQADYAGLFGGAFGRSTRPTLDLAADAIAAYETTLVRPTRYDRFIRGDSSALTPVELRGMALFAGLGCRECHRDPSFSAAGYVQPAGVMKPFPLFANNRLVNLYRLNGDPGAAAPGSRIGLWRVPSLRNVSRTAPYFHNGSVGDLRMAVRIMLEVQLARKIWEIDCSLPQAVLWNPRTRRITFLRPDKVTRHDIDALVAFLGTLALYDEPKAKSRALMRQ